MGVEGWRLGRGREMPSERCGCGRELSAMGVLMIMMMIPYTCNNLFVFVFVG